MAKKVPQKEAFDQAEKWDRLNKTCRRIIAALSIVTIGMDFFKWEFIEAENGIIIILFLATLFNIYCKLNFDKCYRFAEETRRCGFLDNAFNTKLTDIESDGYYDTEDIKLGFRRFLANLHENCLYSNRISNQMLKASEKKYLCAVAVICIVGFSNFLDMKIAVAIVDLIIVMEIFEDYKNLKSFKEETDDVLKECRNLWSNYTERYNNPDNKTMASIMNAYSKYEAILANKTIMLDSAIFNEMNDGLKEEWENIKKRYNI